MKGYSIEPEPDLCLDLDLDKTDELPVLSVEAILEYERAATRQSAGDTSLADAIESLLTALENADRRWRSLEGKLDSQNRAIVELRRRLDGKAVTEGEATAIPILADYSPPRDLPAAPAERPTIGFARLTPHVAVGSDSRSREEQILLDRIASLESYIAEKAERWQRLENELSGNTLRIAELELELAGRLAGERAREQSERERPAASAALVCLSSDAGESYSINKPIFTLGHAPDCDVRITTNFGNVERAAIRRDDSGTFIEDISGTKAVYVNGEQVARRYLFPGDEIEIGAARFRFLIGAQAR